MSNKVFGDRYEILEKIGAGGMAIVYKAKDLLLNRIVTIKVLREQFVTDEDFIRRFRREAQSAASLSHPNIVSIYDVGKDGDMEYIVMEYVEGHNLKELIREYAPLSVEQSINLGKQITEAIQNAHEHHIIHRDIKPHNILVTSDGHAKVTDFGIALAVSSATVTHTEDIVGSVHYLSPEQAKGLQCNEQSDLYSLGIVLYELVTGKVPYDGETPIAIALKHLQEQPLLPSKLNPLVDKEFEAVIMRAIDKFPAQRYPSAKELLADLSRLQAGQPVAPETTSLADVDLDATRVHQGMTKTLTLLPPDSSPEGEKDGAAPKRWNLTKRQKWIAAGTALLCVVLLSLGGVWLRSYLLGETVEVPNVVGSTIESARIILAAKNLTLVDPDPNQDYVFDEEIKKDYLVSQDPDAGIFVKAGRDVKVKVSNGPEMAIFPDVTSLGMSKDNAENLINNAGFDATKIEYIDGYSATVAKGYVMAQEPAKNISVKKSTPIKLTISLGPTVTQNMPNVIGKPAAEAQRILENYGLKVKIESRISDAAPEDEVISTSPNPGDPLRGTEVIVVVSLGEGPLARGLNADTFLAWLK